MRNSRPQSLENLFDDASADGVLRNIQQRAMGLTELNRTVKALLPVQLHPWCRVGNYRQGILILEIANASWLMRLRFEQAALLTALRAQILPSLLSIDIRINPSLAAIGQEFVQESNTQAPKGKIARQRQLSQQSALVLREVAKRSPEKLQQALERLASLAGEGTSEAKYKG